MGFRNFRALGNSLTGGKNWISSFRKVPPVSATIAGQWYDYSYAAGNPIPNYYAASPLESSTLESDKGIIVPLMSGTSSKLYLHRVSAMTAAAGVTVTTSQNQPLILLDYLLFYPFVDMDTIGEEQIMSQSVTLPRYQGGEGLQIMVIAQAPTIGGGRFTITYIGSDDVQYTTETIFCAAAQPSGALVNAVGGATGVSPFIPLNANVRGVKSIVSCNFSIANGGLCAIVIVKPLTTHYVMEESRRTTAGTLESFGDVIEKEYPTNVGAMIEIKDGAFLGFIGQGTAGSIASAPLVGLIETVWN